MLIESDTKSRPNRAADAPTAAMKKSCQATAVYALIAKSCHDLAASPSWNRGNSPPDKIGRPMVTFQSRATWRRIGKATNVDNGIERHPLTFYGDVTGADSPASVDELPKRGSLKRWSMIAAALAIVVVVSFVVIGGSGPGAKDAAAQVMLGARTTLAKDTVKFTIHGSISDNTQSIPITGSGVANLSSNTESVSLAFDANYTAIRETVVADG